MFAAAIGATACTTGFEEVNIDPNNPSAVGAGFLLTQSQYHLSNVMWGGGLNYGFGMLMVQHWAENEYTGSQRYDFNIASFNGSWTSFYTTGGLANLNEAEKLVKESTTVPNETIRANQLAILGIMKSWAFQQMTDLWGDIPYSQALNYAEFQNPNYDSQEDVYNGILTTLTAAVNSITESEAGFSGGDAVFYGDMSKWKKFGNSLILRMALRMSDVNPSAASSYATQAINSGVMTDASDAAYFFYGSESAIANPMYRNVVIGNRDDYSVSDVLINHMQANSDPRLPNFADEAAGGGYVGMPYGLDDNSASTLKNTTSRPSETWLRSATRPAIWMNYSEVLFLQAEAAARGIGAGNATDLYENAIRASMGEWGITDAAAIDAYVAAVPYNAANYKESIGTEKWVALYGCGLEGYAEWRRLDVPSLAVPAAAAQPAIPVRLFYSSDESATNLSYGQTQKNNNNLTTKLWWDVN